MTNRKSTKRALLGSVMAMVLCLAMLVGATFAWFTDTASTGVNKIQAGKLDVALEMKDASGNWVSAEGKTLNWVKAAAGEQVLWEPGCTYTLPELRVVNNGNLALKYKVTITGINGSAKLNEVIDWTINDADINLTEMQLKAGEEGAAFTIKGHMQESAGNEYMNESIDGIAITVVATQNTVESDSFNNTYDANATYPVVAVGDVNTDGDTVIQDREKDPTVIATIPAGSTFAILGGTGSGKSTLMHLLDRLYDLPDGKVGSIAIGGVDIRQIPLRELYDRVAFVSQDNYLFDTTIRENIRIVSPRASDLEVEEAARTAAVHDVIEDFEDGYDTVVGERGVTLSGGQQQRIAIARTLMQKAPILIFDDSMSAVDTQTDAKIRDALYSMRKKGVVFIISHRITTLCEADKILVLDHGKLVQEGTHSELIKQEGLYRRIAIIQDAMGKEA